MLKTIEVNVLKMVNQISYKILMSISESYKHTPKYRAYNQNSIISLLQSPAINQKFCPKNRALTSIPGLCLSQSRVLRLIHHQPRRPLRRRWLGSSSLSSFFVQVRAHYSAFSEETQLSLSHPQTLQFHQISPLH